MSLIALSDVTFSYDSQPVFQHVSLQVERGTICCLLGANGCGKSTMIDCVLGLNQPGAGSITVNGKAVGAYRAEELAKVIAYVPQVHQQSFPYTVRQIVLMGRTARLNSLSGPGEKENELVDKALERVGIFHLAERPYTQISGGETQLVMLARALVQETPVIVMDEPTAHLDYRNELIFLETAAMLVQTLGVSILMATHSPNQAFYLAEHGVEVQVAVMYAGTVAAVGTPEQTLTAEMIRAAYGVEVNCIAHEAGSNEIRHQIIPLRVLK